MLARVGVDQVGVRVAEAREYQPSRGVDFPIHWPLATDHRPLTHLAESLDDTVLNEQIGILDGLHLRHLLTLRAQLRLVLNLHQLLDILNKYPHNHLLLMTAKVRTFSDSAKYFCTHAIHITRRGSQSRTPLRSLYGKLATYCLTTFLVVMPFSVTTRTM